MNTRRPGVYGESEEESQLYDPIMPTQEEILSVLQRMGAAQGKPYPGSDRQKEQRGQAKRYFQKWYQKNRGKVRSRMERWYARAKNKGTYQRDQERRKEKPERFERKPGGASTLKQRGTEYREKLKNRKDKPGEKKAEALFRPVGFYHLPTQAWGVVMGVSQLTGWVTFQVGGMYQSRPLVEFFDEAVIDDDYFFGYLDKALGYQEAMHTAEMLYERVDRKDPPGQAYDRATDRKERVRKKKRNPGMKTFNDFGEVTNNPGSAKVIPEGHDFQNKEGRRFAFRISDIMSGVDDSIREKVTGLTWKLKKVDQRNGMWLFDVNGNSGTYRVRVQGKTKGNARRLSKADVFLSCDCPYWRWQGPEHWAKQNGYLYGKPRGTASFPVIKDPVHEHGVCKHVLAVLDHALGLDWDIPRPRHKRGSEAPDPRYLSDMLINGEVWTVHTIPSVEIRTLAARYLELKGRSTHAPLQL
jgi:hypothetical protein